MSFESEKQIDYITKRSTESRDIGTEVKDVRELTELKKAAAKERAETVSREVKNTKQQMQNIIANMQQVVKAVLAIRQMLGLDINEGIPMVQQDEKKVEELKKKLENLRGELSGLRNALLLEEIKNLEESGESFSENNVKREAEKRVDIILDSLGLNERE